MTLMKYVSLAILLSAFGAPVEAREMTSIFDTSISEKIIPIRSYAENPSDMGTLGCFYYDGFMVKEVDMKEKGADKLSILPIGAGKRPLCERDNANDIVVKDWYGYFAGVKGKYIFFSSDDSSNGAMEYAVFDGESGTRLFTFGVEMPDDGRSSPSGNMHSLDLSDDSLTILYRRVYSADCSLYGEQSGCWPSVRKQLKFPEDASAPDCLNIYEEARQRIPTHAAEMLTVPTIFGYEAKLTYSSGYTDISKQPGAVKCWIAE